MTGKLVMPATGWLLDNVTGMRRSATVEVNGGHFVIRADGLDPQMVDPMLLRHVEMQRGQEVYALAGVEGWRLGFRKIDDPLIEARLPEIRAASKKPMDLTLWIGGCAFFTALANAAAPLF